MNNPTTKNVTTEVTKNKNISQLCKMLRNSADVRKHTTHFILRYLINTNVLIESTKYTVIYKPDRIAITKPDKCTIEFSYKEEFVVIALLKMTDAIAEEYNDILSSHCEKELNTDMYLILDKFIENGEISKLFK